MADLSSPLPIILAPSHLPLADSPSPEIEAMDFAFRAVASSPQSLKLEAATSGQHVDLVHDPLFSSPPAPPLDEHKIGRSSFNYNFGNGYEDSSSVEHHDGITTEEEQTDGESVYLRGAGDVSSRSSISSLPASVMVERKHDGYAGDLVDDSILDTPTRVEPRILHHHREGSLGYIIRSPGSGSYVAPEALHTRSPRPSRNAGLQREYSPAFRNPSSVRAMQMRDESVFNDDGDDEVDPLTRRSVSTLHHRRGSRLSGASRRSGGSTQTSPTKSRRSGGSPLKNSRTEFPLVLLHCTLLPPTIGGIAVQGALEDDTLLREVLPELYWKRWRILREKVKDNVEVRTRGVLIPHPRGEYDLLEEKLLESLELERARVREGHFTRGLDGEEQEPEQEPLEDSRPEEGADETSKKVHCPDCGHKLSTGTERERSYEVKIYAGNGLMAAGAWGAAWQQMEKVDVEVGVWMPEEIRREVEHKLFDLGIDPYAEEVPEHAEEDVDEVERRRREVYGDRGNTNHDQAQEKVDGLFDDSFARTPHRTPRTNGTPRHARYDVPFRHAPHSLQQLVGSYIRSTLEDGKNIFILVLSVVVLFYALQQGNSTSSLKALSHDELSTTSVSVTVSSIQTSTLTVTEVATATTTTTTTTSSSTAFQLPEILPDLPSFVASALMPELSTTPVAEADILTMSQSLSQPSRDAARPTHEGFPKNLDSDGIVASVKEVYSSLIE